MTCSGQRGIVAFSLVGVRIKSALHLGTEQFGWAISAFALAYALFEIPSGMWGDRIGQRSVLIRIVLCWSLFTALTGLTTGLASLIIVRFLFGAGEAGCWPNGTAALSRWIPANERGRGQSFMGIGSALGNALTPLIVVPIAVAFGWRVPFFVIALFGVVWVLVCYFWFRDNPSELKNISKEEVEYIESNRKNGSHRHHFTWKTIANNRNLWALPLFYFGNMFAWNFFVYWLPVYLQDGRHFSENQMKLFTTFIYVAGALGVFLTGFIMDWLVKTRGLTFGRRFIGISFPCTAALMFFLLGFIESNTIAVICVLSAFFVCCSASRPAWSACIDIGGNSVGFVAGTMNAVGQTAGFVIGIVVGRLVHVTHSYTSSLFLIAAVLIGGAMMWLLVDPTKKLTTETPMLKFKKAVPA